MLCASTAPFDGQHHLRMFVVICTMQKIRKRDKSEIVELLQSHSFTREMKGLLLARLARLAELVQIDQDEVFLGPGDQSHSFYLLLSGSVFLELRTAGYTICIEHIQSGDAFGWWALVDKPYRAFQVRAQGQCRAVRLNGTRLQNACEADAELGSHIFRKLADLVARRLLATELRLMEFCGTPHRGDGRTRLRTE